MGVQISPSPLLFAICLNRKMPYMIMVKGASTAIVTILIVMISVSLALLVYRWMVASTPEVEQNVQEGTQAKSTVGCIKIESIDTVNKKISVRNCGTVDLSNVVLSVDSNPVGFSDSVKAGSLVTINYDMTTGPHEVFASSDHAQSSRLTVDTTLSFDFSLSQDYGFKMLVCS
jgi:hypothetical protein